MTPERIAQLRGFWVQDPWEDDMKSTPPCIHEMLDEIERLRGLIAEAHELWFTHYDRTGTEGIGGCKACGWMIEETTFIRAAEAHAAHVDALIPGWRP